MSKTSPSIASMTGFARTEGEAAGFTFAWEARSVNGKSLDVRLRYPPGWDRLDMAVRQLVQSRFSRGNFSLSLQIEAVDREPRLRINRDLLDSVLGLARELEAAGVAPPSADGLLAVRGVIETSDERDDEAREAAVPGMLTAADEAIEALAAARADEGARLERLVLSQLDEIARLTAAAGDTAQAQPTAMRARLAEQLAQLLDLRPPVPEERLAQELALLATRGDIREELDRLGAHVEQAREMIAAGGPIGRRLDFLCQEFNREANTLCSKSGDTALTRIGLDLKTVINQMREQVQNVE
ncbi:MAG: YicC/YloC family endoribonuclease [Azospirillaceae bacterium]